MNHEYAAYSSVWFRHRNIYSEIMQHRYRIKDNLESTQKDAKFGGNYGATLKMLSSFGEPNSQLSAVENSLAIVNIGDGEDGKFELAFAAEEKIRVFRSGTEESLIISDMFTNFDIRGIKADPESGIVAGTHYNGVLVFKRRGSSKFSLNSQYSVVNPQCFDISPFGYHVSFSTPKKLCLGSSYTNNHYEEVDIDDVSSICWGHHPLVVIFGRNYPGLFIQDFRKSGNDSLLEIQGKFTKFALASPRPVQKYPHIVGVATKESFLLYDVRYGSFPFESCTTKFFHTPKRMDLVAQDIDMNSDGQRLIAAAHDGSRISVASFTTPLSSRAVSLLLFNSKDPFSGISGCASCKEGIFVADKNAVHLLEFRVKGSDRPKHPSNFYPVPQYETKKIQGISSLGRRLLEINLKE